MTRNTSISLSDHFNVFIKTQIETGRYSNVSEVVRAGLRLLEEHEQKVEALRLALEDGAKSGDAGPLDFAELKRVARERASLPSSVE